MQRFVFWLAYPLLWVISILPFRLFYMVSDVVYLVVYYLVRYRRETVKENLDLIFPKKTDKEKKRIEKESYKHMVDMFLEMIKSLSISEEELKRRFAFTNLKEIEKIRKTNKSILLVCGHYASFEWMNALQLHGIDYRGFGVYKKIANKYFDQLVRDIRSRYDGVLIPTRKATANITENQKKGILGIYAMVADQNPHIKRAKVWTDFMGIRVPIFTGTEKLSTHLDMAVVYLHVEKVKRGFYQASFKTLSDTPSREPAFSITKNYFKELESQIYEAPEYYLWTHKRWKHRNVPIPKEATVI